MAAQDVLNRMVNEAPDQVSALEVNIQSIQDQVDTLQEESNAITDGILEVDATALQIYLDSTKVEEFRVTYPDAIVVYGSDYNVINITDWVILDSTGGSAVYEYLGTGWDGDSLITEWITDWAFGYDYLTRALTSGATYGIEPQITQLESAITILTANKNKINDSITVFGRYI